MTSGIEKIQRILREFGGRFRIDGADAVVAYWGFSGADVFRLRTDSGEFALRRWPNKSLPVQRILALHRLLDWVGQAGVTQVAVPISGVDGTTLVSIDSGMWQMEPWMPGEANFHVQSSKEKLFEAMGALAAWHRAAATFGPDDEGREWFRCEPQSRSPAVVERLEKLHNWLAGRIRRLEQAVAGAPHDEFRDLARQITQTFHAVAPVVANELRSLATRTYRLQPCLRDVWHDHILFTGNNVTGIVDPSACRLENIATDLARLLGSFVEDDRVSWRLAVDAYRRHNTLDDDEYELMRALDRSSVILSGLFWVDRRYLRGTSFIDEAAVLDRLRTIVRRQRAL